MAQAAIKRDARYTYADYLTWPEDERWELIDGVAYNMTPAPSRKHQKISGDLYRQISTYLFGKRCEVYHPPFDVRLAAPGESDEAASTVVQPDLVIVCDPVKLDDRGCKGAPDLVIEIISPSTAKKDQHEKLLLYERAGVLEYWVVQPADKTLFIYRRGSDDQYGKPDVHDGDERVPVGVLPELEIDLATVFAE